MKLANPIKWGFNPEASTLAVLKSATARKVWASIKAGHVVDQHFNDQCLQFAARFDARPCATVDEVLAIARRTGLHFYGIANQQPDREWWGELLSWLRNELVITEVIPGKVESAEDEIPHLKADKGLKGGSCNVTACQRPGANYFNKSTRRYYCADCAKEINWPGGRADTMALYGTPLLCKLESDEAAQVSN